ncbi:hypothetical protein INR49_015329 [Caranx melampygus]|nr:hypothetical protein INR49_015329 [Caranx melampygus]
MYKHGADMFVLNLVFLAALAASSGPNGIPQYTHSQWFMADESLQYEDTDAQSVGAEESMWPAVTPEIVNPVKVEVQNLPTTLEQYVIKEQDEKKEASAVWKIVLVAVVLLVSVVGSLSTAYYLCVWRGGRIHYQPQKQFYA